jgi:hypothetical protein
MSDQLSQFVAWVAWRLRGGSRKDRPQGLPARIDLAWWGYLHAIKEAARVVSTGLQPKPPSPFDGRGSIFRAPDSGIEDAAEQARAGIRWAALNVGDYDPARWTLYRSRADAAGIRCFPWLRARVVDDLRKLLQVADRWQSEAVLINLESEAVDGPLYPATVAEVVRSEWARPWGLVTLGWLQNGAGWGNISAADRVYLEIFEDVRRQDAPDLSLAEYAARCVEHAVAEGVPDTGPAWPTTGRLRRPPSASTPGTTWARGTGSAGGRHELWTPVHSYGLSP